MAETENPTSTRTGTHTRRYTGGCHCGKVRYEVEADLGRVFSCNCSICSKKGHLLSFVPAQQFKLLSGDDVLNEYQFNTRKIHHLFCRVCGIQSFARGTDRGGKATCAINVRCLDDVDLDSLNVTKVDGKRL